LKDGSRGKGKDKFVGFVEFVGLKNGARQTAQGTRRTVKYEDAKLPFLPQTHADGS
jgi:hypothetical protein